ncbi:DUF3108 domain-containing protein [Tropicimonas sediminicola]|uniref:DUF3108 domain-containing protein n=1 Tax=Tropicimonas sediminicola TaxID=1031541 RepID=A0A239CN68_9RHOB|nr:DUF3108 domain-containing protein [Tropicimonas sediminicola]SNS21570.1 Protein of unknown function [Tropicimonas sediminicola]
MRRLTAVLPALALALAILPLRPLAAQEEQAVFDVSFAGIRGGTLSIGGAERDGQYTAAAVAESSGLVGGIYRLRAEARSSGRVSGNRYTPAAYDEATRERGESKTKQIRFPGGIATVTQDPPDTKRKDWHAEGKDHPGVVDPMTGLFALLRSRPAGLACDLDISTYDGREVHRIKLSGGRQEGDRFVCPAQYIRVDGYKPKDLADTSFRNFEVTYDTSRGDLWPVVEVRARTSYGSMVFSRR